MSRRVLDELVLQRLKSVVDHDGVIQLQSDLMSAALRATPDDGDPDKALRRARRYLRRAWLEYGYELDVVMKDIGEAGLLPPR